MTEWNENGSKEGVRMKKRKIVYIGIFLLEVVTYMIISGALSNGYLRTIRINWGIDLPKKLYGNIPGRQRRKLSWGWGGVSCISV